MTPIIAAWVAVLGLVRPQSRLLGPSGRADARIVTMCDHPWSEPTAKGSGPLPTANSDDAALALPEEARPREGREPRDVILLVLNALRNPDEPFADYGPQMAIAHSSPTNGASQLTPGQFRSYLSESAYQIFTEWDEWEMEDDLEMNADKTEAYQEVLVKRSGDTSWTHINWELTNCNGVWMTQSVVTY